MNNKITIDEAVFNEMMKLVYLFVPSDRLTELEQMISQRNKDLEAHIYQKSIAD